MNEKRVMCRIQYLDDDRGNGGTLPNCDGFDSLGNSLVGVFGRDEFRRYAQHMALLKGRPRHTQVAELTFDFRYDTTRPFDRREGFGDRLVFGGVRERKSFQAFAGELFRTLATEAGVPEAKLAEIDFENAWKYFLTLPELIPIFLARSGLAAVIAPLTACVNGEIYESLVVTRSRIQELIYWAEFENRFVGADGFVRVAVPGGAATEIVALPRKPVYRLEMIQLPAQQPRHAKLDVEEPHSVA